MAFLKTPSYITGRYLLPTYWHRGMLHGSVSPRYLPLNHHLGLSDVEGTFRLSLSILSQPLPSSDTVPSTLLVPVVL